MNHKRLAGHLPHSTIKMLTVIYLNTEHLSRDSGSSGDKQIKLPSTSTARGARHLFRQIKSLKIHLTYCGLIVSPFNCSHWFSLLKCLTGTVPLQVTRLWQEIELNWEKGKVTGTRKLESDWIRHPPTHWSICFWINWGSEYSDLPSCW